jgi:cyclopropane fatty-acyl-phospholipid synthase-like methyltransferase
MNMSKSVDVQKYYDEKTYIYLKIYGNVIQAFRPSSEKSLLKYLSKSIGFKKGQNILDAGCGVGGPAIYFASEYNITIDGITISSVQATIANEQIKKKKLEKRVSIIQGDYHKLQETYPSKKFDGILFLESLGHSDNAREVIRQAAFLTLPGGFIYIKDFFRKESNDTGFQKKTDTVIERMNLHYQYNTLKLLPILEELRANNFEIEFIKKFDFKDDTNIRAKFETYEGIHIFEGFEEFWPAEWLEIKCTKFLL